MKLRSKMFSVFGIALAINLVAIWFGLTYVLDQVSLRLMQNQAMTFTTYLQHQMIKEFADEPDQEIPDLAARKFDLAIHVSEQSQDFVIRKILLVRPDLKIENGWPLAETGRDYSTHADIREAFADHRARVVTELVPTPDGTETDIDVVSWFEFTDVVGGTIHPRVLEVKLDFAGSVHLLEAQYQVIEFTAVGLAMLLMLALLLSLLALMGRTAIRPVQRVSAALEEVASGNLEIQLPESGRDEFGLLARRFNEMTVGLKEKLQLSRYVSRSTLQAVRQAVSAGESDRLKAGQRSELAVFFSDIRGFTSYSENRDPAEVIATLNSILSLQADIIPNHGGDIDKFVGDEVMAVFDSPLAAIHGAIAIQKELARIRPQIAGLHVGIGIHYGPVVQGDVGSRNQKDFTVIGDTVNTAARLQAVSAPDQILISEAVLEKLDPHRDFGVSAHGLLTLKGKDSKLKSYRIAWDD